MTCSFIKPDGKQCKANAIKNSKFCFSHNPDYSEEKALAVQNGGLNRHLMLAYGEEMPLETPRDVKNLLGKVILGVWTGKMPSNNPATAIGFLSRAFLDAFEASTVEEKIAQLEGRLENAGI
jgi:hypothetical protein